MFKKVLIAEDHESLNTSLVKTLGDIGITDKDYTYYCDDAFLHIQKAFKMNDPYDLLITDLYFEEDSREQRLKDGMDLIKAVRGLQPGIPVLVFSAESKVTVIDKLFRELEINGYVRKARRDVEELKRAISEMSNNKKYMPAALRHAIKTQNTYEFTDYDIIILTKLSQGMRQKDIPYYLEENNIKPSGLSSIEKRLNFLKETLGCSKNEQLIAFCKDIGLI